MSAAYTKPGIRPWVDIGGGFAEVDATVKTAIVDCGEARTRRYVQRYANAICVNQTDLSSRSLKGNGTAQVEATKQLELSFVTAGGGIMYAIAKNHGPMVDINLMIPFPSTGVVVEPTIGYAYGFWREL